MDGSRHALGWVAKASRAGTCACVIGAGAAGVSLTGHASSSLLLKGGCTAIGLGSLVILAGEHHDDHVCSAHFFATGIRAAASRLPFKEPKSAPSNMKASVLQRQHSASQRSPFLQRHL